MTDFASGTFNYKADYSMSFFLTLVILFLLLEKSRNYFVRHKFIIALWLSLTVIVANSQIIKIPLIIVWLVYIATNLRFRTLITVGIGVILLSLIVSYLSESILMTEKITVLIDRLNSEGDINLYFAGTGSRTAAIKYFLSDGFSWFGAGPSAYFDPINRILTRGNTGHSFTFFSEVGFLGWLSSLLVIFIISFASDEKIRISKTRILIFSSMIILSFTNQIMNDPGVFIIFCIMLRINLIPTLHSNMEKKNSMISGVKK